MISLESIKRLMDHPNTPVHEKEAARVAYEKLKANPKYSKEFEDSTKWIHDRYDELMKQSRTRTTFLGNGFSMQTSRNFEIHLDENGRV